MPPHICRSNLGDLKHEQKICLALGAMEVLPSARLTCLPEQQRFSRLVAALFPLTGCCDSPQDASSQKVWLLKCCMQAWSGRVSSSTHIRLHVPALHGSALAMLRQCRCQAQRGRQASLSPLLGCRLEVGSLPLILCLHLLLLLLFQGCKRILPRLQATGDEGVKQMGVPTNQMTKTLETRAPMAAK